MNNNWKCKFELWIDRLFKKYIMWFYVVFPKPKSRPVFRPHQPFWGPMEDTLDFTGSVLLQYVRICRRWVSAPDVTRLVFMATVWVSSACLYIFTLHRIEFHFCNSIKSLGGPSSLYYFYNPTLFILDYIIFILLLKAFTLKRSRFT